MCWVLAVCAELLPQQLSENFEAALKEDTSENKAEISNSTDEQAGAAENTTDEQAAKEAKMDTEADTAVKSRSIYSVF
jgi:hypothetical protein